MRFEGRTLDRDALDRGASAIAEGLEALGVQRGDRVLLVLPNRPEFIFGYLGTLRLGAVAVSVNPRLTAQELGFVLSDSRAKVVLTLRELAFKVDAAPGLAVACLDEGWPGPTLGDRRVENVQPDHPAAIVYTSGTTGTPRGAVLSHQNVLFTAQSKQKYLDIRPDDRLMLFLPLFHCFGQNAVLNAALQSGASVLLHRAFDLETVLRSVKHDQATMFFAVPPVYRLLLETAEAGAFPQVRLFFSAAAPLPQAVEDAWLAKFGRPILQGYGLTETSPFASYNHREQYRPGSIGTPIDEVAMKVVSLDTGQDLPVGDVGEIAIKGPNVMLGYWDRSEATRAVVRDGWFFSGDVGRMDQNGYFYLVDRVKDMINAGGLKVYPAEVENVLGRHPAVSEAAVFGIPDEVLGETPAARVVRNPGAEVSEQALMAWCARALAPHKVPSLIEWADSLPRGPTGKVLKRVLRQEFEGRERPETALQTETPDIEAIRAWLRRWVAQRSGIEGEGEGEGDVAFSALGLSSIDAVGMMRALEEFVGQPLSASMPWVYPSVSRLAARVAELTGAKPRASTDPNPADDDSLLRLLAQEVETTRRYLGSASPHHRD